MNYSANPPTRVTWGADALRAIVEAMEVAER